MNVGGLSVEQSETIRIAIRKPVRGKQCESLVSQIYRNKSFFIFIQSENNFSSIPRHLRRICNISYLERDQFYKDNN